MTNKPPKQPNTQDQQPPTNPVREDVIRLMASIMADHLHKKRMQNANINK